LTESLFSDFQPIAAISTTSQSAHKLHPLCQSLGITLHLAEQLTECDGVTRYSGSLKDHLARLWPHHRAFIFGLATGAVVRLISPLLTDKATDPAVIVIDPQGRFVISLCGGHQGGSDRLACLIAAQLGAIPILTGAAQALNLPGIDTLGEPFGWRKGAGDWTEVSAAIANGKPVEVIQEVGSTLWQKVLPDTHPFVWQGVNEPQARIWISITQGQWQTKADCPQVQWHPRLLWVGIGCVRGTSQALIHQAIEQVFQSSQLTQKAIAGIATIDIKADEIGLLAFCDAQQFPLKTFTAAQLNQIPVPTPSQIVEQEVGTASVAEAAALCAAQTYGEAQLLVPKQIIKASSESNSEAVTVAIALASEEYIGKTGALYLVGTGPGALEQITPAAKTALIQADAIIGYSLYLDLIKPLIRAGQIIEAFPITQERQRCQRAIQLAQWGLKVAVISSGDCGIYGMAGLVLEELQKQNWDGLNPAIEVFPGITALQAAAAKVGAPLMHDFCAISLSDLLTPTAKILQRLEAAAQADFVTALYNPRSQKRTELITLTQQIFLKHRHPNNPVVLVRSVYRQEEEIVQTTLDKMLDFPIDMLTVVLIGNSTTYQYQNWLITPRGY
jgi:cobalt-precorrin 5A hydrolase/precorrin-3B C17-methyltransferase